MEREYTFRCIPDLEKIEVIPGQRIAQVAFTVSFKIVKESWEGRSLSLIRSVIDPAVLSRELMQDVFLSKIVFLLTSLF